MSTTSISDALKEKKATIINIKVLRKISETAYVIGDPSGQAILEVDGKVSLKEDTFVKLVKPSFSNNAILMNQSFKIVKGKYFEHTFEPKAIDKMCENSGKASQEVNLLDIEEMKIGVQVPCLTLKVCAVSKPYTGKFSDYRNVQVKDFEGSKVTIVLYRNLKDSCQVGKVYDFYKLKKTNYKPEGEKICRLSSQSLTKIEEAAGIRIAKFEDVSIGDQCISGEFVGNFVNTVSHLHNWCIFLGFSDIVSYDACKACNSKVNGDKCAKCLADVTDPNNCVLSFFFTIMVALDEDVVR